MDKETVYDEQINPLMDQIIQICQQNRIAMLASFSLSTETDPGLACSTALLTDDYQPPSEFLHAYRIIRSGINLLLVTKLT